MTCFNNQFIAYLTAKIRPSTIFIASLTIWNAPASKSRAVEAVPDVSTKSKNTPNTSPTIFTTVVSISISIEPDWPTTFIADCIVVEFWNSPTKSITDCMSSPIDCANSLTGPSAASTLNEERKFSHCTFIAPISPAKLSKLVLAISVAVPVASNDDNNSLYLSPPAANICAALALSTPNCFTIQPVSPA